MYYLYLLIAPLIVFCFNTNDIYTNPIIRFMEFSMGIILSFTVPFLKEPSILQKKYTKGLINILLYISIVVFVSLLAKLKVPHVMYMAYSSMLLPLLLLLVTSHVYSCGQSANHVIRFFSDISYPFYLAQLFSFKFALCIGDLYNITDKYVLFLISIVINFLFAILMDNFVVKLASSLFYKRCFVSK